MQRMRNYQDSVRWSASASARGLSLRSERSRDRAGGDLVSSLNSATSSIKLPWAKYPGEMHLPGMNFAGPGTRLDLRLNPNGTPKDSSLPVDRVDEAAYRHDMAYAAFPDTKTRNIADRIMVSEMNEIPNPTLRERVERSVIKPILNSKAKFGLGIGQKKKKI
jgi:hypothetical protein